MNDACVNGSFPTLFTNEFLDNVAGQEAYSFTDGFSGYHQIKIALKDRSKTTFSTEWGSFQYTVMSFGLKNAPTIFSRFVVTTFKEFIHKFLEVYFDDKAIFGMLKKHVSSLRLMLDTYRKYQISLNLKSVFFVYHMVTGTCFLQAGVNGGPCKKCFYYQVGLSEEREAAMHDSVRLIQPLGKKTGARYIIIVIDYLTRWVEAQPVKDCSIDTFPQFIFEYILSIFGCLNILMSN